MKAIDKPAAKKSAVTARTALKVATGRPDASGCMASSKSAALTDQKASLASATAVPFRFEQMFLTSPQERIDVIKRGVPAKHVNGLAARMNVPKESLIDTLRLSRATLNRKVRDNQPLSQDESERVLGVEYLIGQAENMVRQSGDPKGFDAARWVSNWLNSPMPGLGNQTPVSYMDTVEGQKLVSNLLATVQSGAYV